MVNEYTLYLRSREGVIADGRKLVRVPYQVDIESGDNSMAFILGHYLEKHPVLADEVTYGRSHVWRTYPANIFHLVHKRPLPYDRPDQVDGEGG